MKWPDVDLKNALWTLPAEVTKNGRIHYVPLSKAAVELLKVVPKFTNGEYVWTTTRGEMPINGFSNLKEKIDKCTLANRQENNVKKNIPGWTMHDIRRTVTTLMAEKCKVLPHILTRILNHTSESDRDTSKLLRKVYDRYQYLDEKREALEAWAKYVATLTEDKPVSQTGTA